MAMKMGLVGLGAFAKGTIIPATHMTPEVELAAVYDEVPEAIADVAATLPEGVVCASASELIQRRDLDLVYVATRPPGHKELVEQVIAAKRNIVCEKPFTTNSSDARYLADLAAKAGLVNVIDHEMRYSSIYLEMKERISAGYIGQPVVASTTVISDYARNPLFTSAYYWGTGSMRSGAGGILHAYLNHFIDLYVYLLGGIEPRGGYAATMLKEKPERIDTVGADGVRVFSEGPKKAVDADDSIVLSGRLPNGAPASIVATWSVPVSTGSNWLIQGDEGVLVYQSGDEITGLWNGKIQGARAGESLSTIPTPPEIVPSDGMARYMSSLVAAELVDAAQAIDGGIGRFATFASECGVWDALDGWDVQTGG
ncbi:Gfo/Idh/MocA family protein [Sphingobium bisphenolivorans]|uniref:Gfo/Idh/MocA family protein n=1 Tax=Sphingobium bisphenolivorans TaxID=1335760 RepID=UPI00039DF545|nr:Gfo/Idh/MocA family oxidoreductase [Sphingobium bisphenolivorans]